MRLTTQVLKQKRLYEGQREQLYNQQFNMDQTAFTLESIKDSVQTVQAMKAANVELKQAFKKGELNIDSIEKLQDEMADMHVRYSAACCSSVLACHSSWLVQTCIRLPATLLLSLHKVLEVEASLAQGSSWMRDSICPCLRAGHAQRAAGRDGAELWRAGGRGRGRAHGRAGRAGGRAGHGGRAARSRRRRARLHAGAHPPAALQLGKRLA